MAPNIATARRVDLPELLDFLRPRHHGLLSTTRADGRPQLSPVSCGVDDSGRIVVFTYPDRAKAVNARRDDRVSICVLSDDWNGPYVQVDGRGEVLDMPRRWSRSSSTTGASRASTPTGTSTARPCGARTSR